MVFRKKHTIYKNGRIYTYYSLARSVRIPGRAAPTHQYLGYMGKLGPELSYRSGSDISTFSSIPLQRVVHFIGEGGKFKKETEYYEPMRPVTAVEIPKEGYLAEIKYDGSRSSFLATKEGQAFINRRNVETTERYPEFLDIYKKLRFNKSIVLDGEITHVSNAYPYGDFKKLSMREHLIHPDEIKKRSKEIPLTFFVFDILELDEKSLLNTPLSERKKILNEVVPDNIKNIKEVKYKMDGKSLLDIAKKKRGEGVVFKKLDSFYEPKKESKDWLKAKILRANDITILGFSEGTGKRKGLFGSLIMGVWDKNHWKYVGKVGTGFKDEELKRLYKKMKPLKTAKELFHLPGNITWIKPDIVVRVNFLRETPQGRYREPRYVSERLDIPVKSTHPTKIKPIKAFGSFSFSSLRLTGPILKIEKKGKIITTRKPEEVYKIAKYFKNKLTPYSKRISMAGSIRRKVKDPKDIDILIIPKDRKKVDETLRKEGTEEIFGIEEASIMFNGVKVDVHFATPKTFESHLMFLTGPYGSNIKNREIAREKGYILNQRGLFKRLSGGKPGKLIANTERGIYKALGKTYRPPEERGRPR